LFGDKANFHVGDVSQLDYVFADSFPSMFHRLVLNSSETDDDDDYVVL
jgi:hypothetical protein